MMIYVCRVMLVIPVLCIPMDGMPCHVMCIDLIMCLCIVGRKSSRHFPIEIPDECCLSIVSNTGIRLDLVAKTPKQRDAWLQVHTFVIYGHACHVMPCACLVSLSCLVMRCVRCVMIC